MSEVTPEAVFLHYKNQRITVFSNSLNCYSARVYYFHKSENRVFQKNDFSSVTEAIQASENWIDGLTTDYF